MLTSYTLLACALGAAALPAGQESEGIKVAFNKERLAPRADGTLDGPAFLREINATLHKYHSSSVLPSFGIGGLVRRANSVKLTDQVERPQVDELYYGPISISGQSFTTDFDTGSADLFVPGPKCTKADGCTGPIRYDQSGTDQMKTTSVTYGSGQVAGENYFDTVSVAGLTATHTNLISLTTAKGFSGSASSSLMGMGFSTISNSKEPTFFENLISQGKVAQKRFAFYLGRARSNTQGNSELTLGGVDASRYTGTISKVPVTTKGYWQVGVAGVSVNKGSSIASTSGQAAIDTGTTVIIAPTVAATSIFAQIPGAFPVPLASGSATETIFAYPCNTKHTIDFQFNGQSKKFSVNQLDMNIGTITTGFAQLIGSNKLLDSLLSPVLGGGSLCAASIIGADLNPGEELYVVGDSFLKNWYSVYDYNGPSVGFAAAKGNQ